MGLLTEELKVEAEHFKLSETNWISNVYQPVRVKGLPPVAQVDCGWSHVLAISGQCTYMYTGHRLLSEPGLL